MKRPPGLWLLLTVVAVWLRVDDVYSLKATALIFGKLSTTTSTAVPDVSSESKSEVGVTEVSSNVETETQNSSKPVLTGIPQIDYIWDPNLPRELNGYNLSEYPFYDRVPEDIKFKCDGLHDGFYASVPHKCQVYHHCLFGIRYDFLCANYTAFDQKTFICHFVSEVDCVNSKKFWHRNDALYKAATTTTVKPTPIYTLPPAPATPVPVPILPLRPTRPRRPMKRPASRPYDYYEEDYADEEYYERPYRRQRPKYRPRYDDEYEYEEEEEYSRRPGRRRPYKQRGSNRRRPVYDDEEYADEEDVRRPADTNRRMPEESRRPSKRRPMEDEDYDRRSYDRPRKKTHRRPAEDDYEEDVQPRHPADRRKLKNNRDETRKYDEEEEEDERPRKNNRDDGPRKNFDRNRKDDDTDKPRTTNDRNKNEEPTNDEKSKKNEKNDDVVYDDKPLPKAPTSVYARPRPILKVRPPVPAHEQAKYAPKVTTTTTEQPLDDEEYYDDYEEDIKKTEVPRSRSKDSINTRNNPISSSTTKREYENKTKQEDYEDDVETTTKRYNKRPKYEQTNRDRRIKVNSRRRPAVEEEYEDYEESRDDKKSNIDQKTTTSTATSTTTTTTTTTTTKEPPREAIVKIVKRPFLPSRGGHPYTSRGLLPVGTKALDTSTNDQNSTQEKQIEVVEDKLETKVEENKSFKPPPVIVKIPVRKTNNYNDEEFRPVSNRPLTRIIKIMTAATTTTTTTTEKPKVVEKNPLDIDESEYDVTLNDALNPTLPNLPIRNFPTGFSQQNDYIYNTVPRQRYVIDPLINQASSDYVYRIAQPNQISSNIRYKSQNIPIFQSYRQTPRVTQAFYAPY